MASQTYILNGQKFKVPKGTSLDDLDSYVKNLDVQAKQPAQQPKLEAKVPATMPQPSGPQTLGQKLSTGTDALQQSIARWRPRWDDPQKVLTDPSWMKASGRYLGGEAIEAGKAGVGGAVGGSKLLHDVASMLDPSENYQRGILTPQGTATQVGHDVVDLGKGILDTGKAGWDLIRHFPESGADPDRVGSTVMNTAMIVDGAIKGAQSAAATLKLDPVAAAHAAHKAMGSVYDGLMKQRAIEDAYVHTKGLDIANKVNKAVGEASKEVHVHTNALSQIDTKIPSGVIDASKEADVITNSFDAVVKAPEKYHPALKSMIDDAKKTAPGQWTFDKARQFRSRIGRAMHGMDGPQYAVASTVYSDLTNKLGSTAKQYGLGESWDHYNELERKIQKSFPTIDKLTSALKENNEGAAVAGALKSGETIKEITKSLSKYGLDAKEVALYAQRANAILRERGNTFKSLFRYAYGNPYGIPAMIAARGVGAGWLGGAAAGAITGLAMTHLVHAVRAMRLAPEITEHMLFSREWPGKVKPSAGTFPKELPKALPETTTPSQPAPQVPPQAAPTPTPEVPSVKTAEVKAGIVTPVPKAKPLSIDKFVDEAKKAGVSQKKIDELVASNKAVEEAAAKRPAPVEAVGREPGARLGTTKESKIGRATKARERVAAQREEAKRTEQKEVAEATKRAQAKDVSVENIQIPEAEEALRGLNPVVLSAMQKLRKGGKIAEPEWLEWLKSGILNEYEKRSSGGTPSE